MLPILKLPMLLGAALLPFLSPLLVHSVVAANGFDSTCNVSYFQSTERDMNPSGHYPIAVWWGRDGMHAFCQGQYVGHEFPVLLDIYRPPGGKPDFYNVAWGQSPDSRTPIFTNQHELGADNSGGGMSEDIFDTRQTFVPDHPKPMYAFFRVQSCVRHALSHSRCVPWSMEPYIVVELGDKELIQHL